MRGISGYPGRLLLDPILPPYPPNTTSPVNGLGERWPRSRVATSSSACLPIRSSSQCITSREAGRQCGAGSSESMVPIVMGVSPQPFSTLPKNPLLPRLLKKVQMQGGAPGTHPEDGRPIPRMGTPQMGLFQQPARDNPLPQAAWA